MIYDIVFHPEPLLHKTSDLVPKEIILTPNFQNFISDMIATMYVKDGVGLAAPQVGRSIKLCVIAKEYTPSKKDLCLINPEWTKQSIKKNWDEEGCLSVPGIYGEVSRYSTIKVKALDHEGTHLEFVARDFFARIIQHEVDHLNGILFIEKAKNLHRLGREL